MFSSSFFVGLNAVSRRRSFSVFCHSNGIIVRMKAIVASLFPPIVSFIFGAL